jgi:hypothetical protein
MKKKKKSVMMLRDDMAAKAWFDAMGNVYRKVLLPLDPFLLNGFII